METDPFIWSQVFTLTLELAGLEPPERTIEYDEEALRHFEEDL
jgi:hypothetical protein